MFLSVETSAPRPCRMLLVAHGFSTSTMLLFGRFSSIGHAAELIASSPERQKLEMQVSLGDGWYEYSWEGILGTRRHLAGFEKGPYLALLGSFFSVKRLLYIIHGITKKNIQKKTKPSIHIDLLGPGASTPLRAAMQRGPGHLKASGRGSASVGGLRRVPLEWLWCWDVAG